MSALYVCLGFPSASQMTVDDNVVAAKLYDQFPSETTGLQTLNSNAGPYV